MNPKLGKYLLGGKIGSGTHSDVYLAEKGKKLYALKIVKAESYKRNPVRIKNEIVIGKIAADACPYSLKYYEAFEAKHPVTGEETYVTVTEYMDGYSLKQLFGCCAETGWFIEPRLYVKFMKWVLETISCLHHEGIVHGDINPGNIYFNRNDQRLFIIDLGTACDYRSFKDFGSTNTLSCSSSKFLTPPAFRFPSTKKDKIQYERKEQRNYEAIFKMNDLYALVALSISFVVPDLFPMKPEIKTLYDARQVLADVLVPEVTKPYTSFYPEDGVKIVEWIRDTTNRMLMPNNLESITAKSMIESLDGLFPSD